MNCESTEGKKTSREGINEPIGPLDGHGRDSNITSNP